MITRFGKALGLAGVAVATSFGGGNAMADVLPSCTPGVNCLVFNDFNVFSLPLLNALSGNSSVPKPGDPFFFSSTYGQIQNFTIIGINNGQSTTTGNPPGSVDGAYNTPSANNVNTFSTLTTSDPGGLNQFTGDNQSWDAKVPALQTLAGGAGAPLIAFFAFNETGKGTGLLNTDLLIWASVTLHDYNANGIDIVPPQTFYLDADNSNGPPPSLAAGDLPAPDGSDANGSGNTGMTPGFGPWVYVHAGICIDSTTKAFKGFPDVNGQCPAGQSVANQNNLGQNAAAFAVNSPSLDAALLTGNWTVASITWEMAYINGGGETAWIQPFTPSTSVPEPATLANVALALCALGFALRRRNRS